MDKKKAGKTGESSKAKKQGVVYSRSFKASEVDLTEFQKACREYDEKHPARRVGVILRRRRYVVKGA